jgi:predicted AlkP superfamily pyrophosphatase or phosphodiesterase
MKKLLLVALTGLMLAAPLHAAKPDLVLLITVDQLRGDMPWRYRDRFGDGGFRYLMDYGTSYSNAHFQHSATHTAPGHATLATGGNIPQHGLASNQWFDSGRQQPVYCIEDPAAPLTGVPAAAASSGRSPRNITSSTFGDELVIASGGRSRVFSVSFKDRGAIIMGGRLGKSFWYSKNTGEFISSAYYYQELPRWVSDWNATRQADRFLGTRWELLQDFDRYVFGAQDDRPYERTPYQLGRTFPHPLGDEASPAYYGSLRLTPMGDQLTLAFVKELLEIEKPGQSGATDVLAISFSVTDYIGHAFGPNSLEAEDNLMHLDRTLAQLLQLIDRDIGLDKTLIVLSADHGVSPIPEHMKQLGFDAGRHQAKQFMAQVNQALQKQFGIDRNLALAFYKPGIFLDLPVMESLGLDPAEVERAVAAEMMKVPGIAMAFSRSDLLSGNIPDTPAARGIAAATHPVRSGNVLVVQNPHWYLSETPDGNAAMHGTPYNYDTHVPIMLAGPGIRQRVITRRVAPRDIAPTLSNYFGILPPSGSVGTPLAEILE